MFNLLGITTGHMIAMDALDLAVQLESRSTEKKCTNDLEVPFSSASSELKLPEEHNCIFRIATVNTIATISFEARSPNRIESSGEIQQSFKRLLTRGSVMILEAA